MGSRSGKDSVLLSFSFNFNGEIKLRDKEKSESVIGIVGCPEIRHIGSGKIYNGNKIDTQNKICFISSIPQGSYQVLAYYFKIEKKEIKFVRANRPYFDINEGGIYQFPSIEFNLGIKTNLPNKRSPIYIESVETLAIDSEKQIEELRKILVSKIYKHLEWHLSDFHTVLDFKVE